MPVGLVLRLDYAQGGGTFVGTALRLMLREVPMSLIVVLVIIVVVVLFLVSTYNGLVTSRNAFKNAFAQIDVQLTRRYDLIPNLVEIAKGYMKHERETLEAVIAARNGAVSGLRDAAANAADAGAVQQLCG